ncbi:hypothetical protein [Methanosarcina sp. 1.H.A.2.2]|uniref:hypothetical protein n=1 Tax=Methanosarcina sp. 1.H.A.2.2 TaxID=1483601 RepID=UPI000621BCA5|nr:hypothetical protein [Methanosarcina sp. 1.H.A.2.2]KKH45980.1 hypothetical protein EO93_06980 [Methanosarcina sp. 1.H.A.2.2]
MKYLEKETLFDHIYNEYFKDYVESQIDNMDTITINGKEVSVIFSSLVNPCISIDDYEDEDGKGDYKLITSTVDIVYEENSIQKRDTFQTETVMDNTGGLEYFFDIKLESE